MRMPTGPKKEWSVKNTVGAATLLGAAVVGAGGCSPSGNEHQTIKSTENQEAQTNREYLIRDVEIKALLSFTDEEIEKIVEGTHPSKFIASVDERVRSKVNVMDDYRQKGIYRCVDWIAETMGTRTKLPAKALKVEIIKRVNELSLAKKYMHDRRDGEEGKKSPASRNIL